MARILIIDDDAELVELLREYLEGEGFEIAAAGDGRRGLEAACDPLTDLVVLDVMLPELNGLDVLRAIRERCPVPVIMLTARGDDVDRIVGLELGADDYLAKPFNPRELLARVRAVLRRGATPGGTAGGRLTVGDLELDPGTREAKLAGSPVELTGAEFALLEILVREAGSVVRRGTLFREVLGRRPSPFDRSLDVHISNLRRKIGDLPDGGERIKTVRGVGYQYARSSED